MKFVPYTPGATSKSSSAIAKQFSTISNTTTTSLASPVETRFLIITTLIPSMITQTITATATATATSTAKPSGPSRATAGMALSIIIGISTVLVLMLILARCLTNLRREERDGANVPRPGPNDGGNSIQLRIMRHYQSLESGNLQRSPRFTADVSNAVAFPSAAFFGEHRWSVARRTASMSLGNLGGSRANERRRSVALAAEARTILKYCSGQGWQSAPAAMVASSNDIDLCRNSSHRSRAQSLPLAKPGSFRVESIVTSPERRPRLMANIRDFPSDDLLFENWTDSEASTVRQEPGFARSSRYGPQNTRNLDEELESLGSAYDLSSIEYRPRPLVEVNDRFAPQYFAPLDKLLGSPGNPPPRNPFDSPGTNWLHMTNDMDHEVLLRACYGRCFKWVPGIQPVRIDLDALRAAPFHPLPNGWIVAEEGPDSSQIDLEAPKRHLKRTMDLLCGRIPQPSDDYDRDLDDYQVKRKFQKPDWPRRKSGLQYADNEEHWEGREVYRQPPWRANPVRFAIDKRDGIMSWQMDDYLERCGEKCSSPLWFDALERWQGRRTESACELDVDRGLRHHGRLLTYFEGNAGVCALMKRKVARLYEEHFKKTVERYVEALELARSRP